MYNNKIYRLGVIIALLLGALSSFSQINTNSPYSRYGIGEMYVDGFGSSRAMGHLNIGQRAHNQINHINPASYTSQDTMTFLFDFGLYGKTTNYKTDDSNTDFQNYNFDHLAIAFPIKDWMFASVGVTPYSTAGYQIAAREYDESINQNVVNTYDGAGGLNEFYAGASIELWKHLSIGGNMLYNFGNMKQIRNFYLDTTQGYVTNLQNIFVMKGLSYSAGIQYYNTINNRFFYTLGFSYKSQKKLKTEDQTLGLLTLNGQFVDTIMPFVSNEYTIDVPEVIGFGVSAGIKQKLTVGVDYTYQDWSDVERLNINNNFGVQSSIKFGLEYIPDFYSVTNYYKRINYRVGGHYTDSYIKLAGETIKNYGITFGVGIPINNPYNQFNISCELGRRGTTNNGLVQEDYAMISLSFTFYDIWFIKRKYN